MRSLAFFLLSVCLGFGTWWLLNHSNTVRKAFDRYVDSDEITTLEAKYTPEQIISNYQDQLQESENDILQETMLRFYPYLLMEVKYKTPDKHSREGILLWGLYDGEMVINTDTWETSRGFHDCIDVDACRDDFRILQEMTANGGSISHDELAKRLQIDIDDLDELVNSARHKHLIISKGNTYYLNLQNPKLNMDPQTKMSQSLSTKSYIHAEKAPQRFSKSQIERTSKAAFGQDFAIRNSKVIFLPVYNIKIQKPNGSIRKTYWNGLTGQRIQPR